MSLMDKFREEFIEKVRYYSQEEGLKDHEIAELLGCSRATVNRTRQSEDIATANLSNRKDKLTMCHEHGTEYLIKRRERRTKKCPGAPLCTAANK